MATTAAILDRMVFLAILIYISPQSFLARLESIGLSIQEKKWKIDFQDGRHGGYLGFPIRMILLFFFIYKLPQCFLPMLELIGLSVQEKQKIDFSSWISDWNDLSYFWSTSHPNASYQVSSQIAFQDGHHCSLDFP